MRDAALTVLPCHMMQHEMFLGQFRHGYTPLKQGDWKGVRSFLVGRSTCQSISTHKYCRSGLPQICSEANAIRLGASSAFLAKNETANDRICPTITAPKRAWGVLGAGRRSGARHLHCCRWQLRLGRVDVSDGRGTAQCFDYVCTSSHTSTLKRRLSHEYARSAPVPAQLYTRRLVLRQRSSQAWYNYRDCKPHRQRMAGALGGG